MVTAATITTNNTSKVPTPSRSRLGTLMPVLKPALMT
jgi:hypothetical protein